VLEEKFILKRAFADILPDAIASRAKQPYRAPISSSFSAGDDTLVQWLLSREALQRSGFANAPAVEKLLAKGAADGAAPSERNEMALATMASLQLLQHLFVDNFQPSGSESPHEERTAVAL
jgi:asparagine synthase (glutamine-hydrolysing)